MSREDYELLGLRTDFIDDASPGLLRWLNNVDKASRKIDEHAKTVNQSAQRVVQSNKSATQSLTSRVAQELRLQRQRAQAAEEAARRIVQASKSEAAGVVGGVTTPTTTPATSSARVTQAAARMTESLRAATQRLAKAQHAQADSTAQADQRMERYERRMQKAAGAVNDYTKAVEESNKAERDKPPPKEPPPKEPDKEPPKTPEDVPDDDDEKKVLNLTKSLRTLRWEIVTMMFFFRALGNAAQAAGKMVADASEYRSAQRGVRALAATYRTSTHQIVSDMRAVSDGMYTAKSLLEVSQQALLQDQGQFASKYGELWEAARVSAVTTGADVNSVFVAMVQALAQADAGILDSTVSIYQAETAMLRYALANGKLVDELTEAEKQQVILNTVQHKTNQLLEAGAGDALEAAEGVGNLKRSWEELTQVIGTALQPTGDFFTHLIEAGTQATALLSGLSSMFGEFGDIVREAGESTQTGWSPIMSILTGVSGEMFTLGGVSDRVSEAFYKGFTRAVEPLEVLKTKIPSVAHDVDELGNVSEASLQRLHDFMEKLRDLQERYMERLYEMHADYAERLVELEHNLAERMAEIAIRAAEKRVEAYIKYTERLEDIELQWRNKLADIEWDYYKKRRDLLQRYYDQVRKIEQRFQDSIYDAISSRNATQALLAIRRRKRDLAEARRKYEQDARNAKEDYLHRLQREKDYREQRRAEAKRQYERDLAQIEREQRRQEDALERSIERQRRELERHLKWREARLERQYSRDYMNAHNAYTNSERQLAYHMQNMVEIIGTYVIDMQRLWDDFVNGLNLPSMPTLPGSMPVADDEHGGATITAHTPYVQTPPVPQDRVPQSRVPVEMVVKHVVTGSVQQEVSAIIDRSVEGFEGRLQAAFVDILGRVL